MTQVPYCGAKNGFKSCALSEWSHGLRSPPPAQLTTRLHGWSAFGSNGSRNKVVNKTPPSNRWHRAGADCEIELTPSVPPAAGTLHCTMTNAEFPGLEQIQGLKEGNVMSLQNAGEWSKAILTLQSVPAAIKTCHETHAFKTRAC